MKFSVQQSASNQEDLQRERVLAVTALRNCRRSRKDKFIIFNGRFELPILHLMAKSMSISGKKNLKEIIWKGFSREQRHLVEKNNKMRKTPKTSVLPCKFKVYDLTHEYTMRNLVYANMIALELVWQNARERGMTE